MATQLKNDEVEYNSSSDEDYDPEKDTELDPQDEIDDVEGLEEERDDEETLKRDPTLVKSSYFGSSGPSRDSHEEDIDALFAELTGEVPKQLKQTSTIEIKREDNIFSPERPLASSGSSKSVSSSVYQPKSDTLKNAAGLQSGKKRVGLLDAAMKMAKKSKLSVLEKSDRDWKDFKSEQNIKEDLESHNRGKGGYLNKMDFLNRTDNRQFEKERAFRATTRKEPGN